MASPAGSVRSTSSQESKDSRARLEDIRARINAKKELSLSLASEVSLSDIGQQNPPHLDGCPEMSSLVYLEVDHVVHNLDVRYGRDQVYTSMQSVLIAVNPYKALGIYGQKNMEQYRSAHRSALAKLPPHCFRVAELAYQSMSRTHKNQSMVICGESGSGKTESAKVFMRYLAHVTGHESGKSSIEQRFLQVNPVLEALGNAQTNMNNNSSRYAKFTQVLFEKKGDPPVSLPPHKRPKQLPRPSICGSFVETYLLEKSRVVHQERGERNYHVFYQLLSGLPKDLKAEFGIEDPPEYEQKVAESKKVDDEDDIEDDAFPGVLVMKRFHYMNQSGQYVINGNSDVDRFNELHNALSDLNFDDAQRKGMYALLVGILYLGNIKIDAVSADECGINADSEDDLKRAAQLFSIDLDKFKARLTSRNIKVGMQVIAKALNQSDALFNRDTMAKSLYHGLFLWVVKTINEQLYDKSQLTTWIGILDVFGFECSDWNNSFEQFCINFANERLQSFFNSNVVMSEQEEYVREALPWTPVDIKDNSDVIDLISAKPKGILAILDSACIMPKGTDEVFMRNLFDAQRRNPRLKQARTRRGSTGAGKNKGSVGKRDRERFLGFILEHYAGKVIYNAQGFMTKNNDTVNQDTLTLFAESTNPVVKHVLPQPAKQGGHRRRASTTQFRSVGSHFMTQLNQLMNTLESTQPYFVRCINPNQFKMASTFDAEYVRPQLEYGGLVEALRILKLGYPSRISYENIYNRYGKNVPFLNKSGTATSIQQKEFTEAVFLAFGLEEDAYKLGLTKVFFRPGKQEWLEDVLGNNPELSPEMLAKIRSLIFRKRFRRLRGAVLLLTRFQMLVDRRRAFQRLARAAGTVVTLAQAFRKPLLRIHQQRAAVTLQAYMRAALQQRLLRKDGDAVTTIQRFLRGCNRRQELHKVLRARIADHRERKAAASNTVYRFFRACEMRAGLTAVLARRVEETKKRKEEHARLAEEKRIAEEKERQRKLAEERERLRKEEEERKRREEEERKRREEEERKRKEEEERQRIEEEERQRKLLEEQERLRVQREEEERKKQEEERSRAEAEIAAREEAKRKAEEERKKKAAFLKAQEERKKMKLAAQQARKAREAKEKEIREQQEKAQREAEELARLEDRAAEELDEREREEEEEVEEEQPGAIAEEEPDGQEEKATGDTGDTGTAKDPKTGKKKKYSIPSHILAAHMAEKKRQAEERHEEAARRLRHILLSGGKFLKYGRRGKPHIKYVTLNALGHLHWDTEPMDPRKLLPSKTFITLKNVLHVVPGKETSIFKRKVARNAPDFLCFSIVSTERTLDLQATNVKERDLWVRAIESAVSDVRSGMIDMISGERAVTSKKGGKKQAKLKRRHTLQPRQIQQIQRDLQNGGGGGSQRAPLAFLHAFKSEEEMMAFVLKGGEFLKFESKGKPQIIYLEATQSKLFWGGQPRPSRTKGAMSIGLHLVERVQPGKGTGTFQYRSTDALSPPENCFSLIFKTWTLDLQVETNEMRNNWVAALSTLVDRARHKHFAKLEVKRAANGGTTRPNPRVRRSQSLRLPVRRMQEAQRPNSRLPPAWTISEEKES